MVADGALPGTARTYDSLSKVAFAITGTKWNGPRFFGLRDETLSRRRRDRVRHNKAVRCAIYTRVSTDAGLDQEFNSLDAQYDAASGLYPQPGPCSLDAGPDPI